MQTLRRWRTIPIHFPSDASAYASVTNSKIINGRYFVGPRVEWAPFQFPSRKFDFDDRTGPISYDICVEWKKPFLFNFHGPFLIFHFGFVCVKVMEIHDFELKRSILIWRPIFLVPRNMPSIFCNGLLSKVSSIF